MVNSTQILLVEDNQLELELALIAFNEAQIGAVIHVARTGQEALDYLFGRDKYTDRWSYPLPDLVILDLKLPGMNGHEVLKQIKETPTLKRLPVVILTSSCEHVDLERSYDMGANSYLVKPITFQDMLQMVHQMAGYWLHLNVAPMAF